MLSLISIKIVETLGFILPIAIGILVASRQEYYPNVSFWVNSGLLLSALFYNLFINQHVILVPLVILFALGGILGSVALMAGG